MKKLIFVILLLIFLPIKSVTASDDIATQSSSLQNNKINYELPYPGILPDNPLYVLKVVRDRVVSLLISDSLKKAEFDLLVSDKRINSGLFLLNNKKDALAISTIAKSNNYFHEAIGQLANAKKEGKATDPLAEKMRSSLKKHTAVLRDAEKTVDPKYKDELVYEEKRVADLVKYLAGTGNP